MSSLPSPTELVETCSAIISRRSLSHPVRLLFASVAGSILYGLDSESSDVDYVGLFALPTDAFLGIDKPGSLLDSVCRTPESPEEDHTFHEVAKFARMLAKGNFAAVELLFASAEAHAPAYTTAAWDALVAVRESFVTKRYIANYLGFLTTLVRRLEKRKSPAPPKKWYNILRGIYVVSTVINTGAPPPIYLDPAAAPDRAAIIERLLMIKSGSQDINYVALAMEARDKLDSLVAAQDTLDLPDNCDLDALNRWVLDVRHDVFWAQDLAANPDHEHILTAHPE